jgi:hypothetical protein
MLEMEKRAMDGAIICHNIAILLRFSMKQTAIFWFLVKIIQSVGDFFVSIFIASAFCFGFQFPK